MKVRVTEGVLQDDVKQVLSGEECVEKGRGEECVEKGRGEDSLNMSLKKKSEQVPLKKEEERVLRATSFTRRVDSIVLCEVSVSRRHSLNHSTSNKQTSLPLSTLSVTLLCLSHL